MNNKKEGNIILQISSYNILSRNNTHYNWRSHRNIKPDISNFELKSSPKGNILIKKNKELESKDIPNTSKFIHPFKSIWYNSNNILTNGILTGLDGSFTSEKNIDHIFVYNNIYNFRLNVLEEEHIYGPYLENDKLSERIGGKSRFNQINLKHIQTFIKSKKPPSKIVRGSDHKMLTLTIS